MYRYGYGIKQSVVNSIKATKWYEESANIGYWKSMLKAGDMNVEKHPEWAIDWYWKAADKGVGEAYFKLADMYYDGLGVEVDMEKASELYTKAKDLGYEGATWTSICASLHGLHESMVSVLN